MNSNDRIESPKNPKVKEALALLDRKARDASGLMLIEGLREISLALKGGVKVRQLFCCEERFGSSEREVRDLAAKGGAEIIAVAPRAFERLAYREGAFGLLAVAEQPVRSLEALPLSDNPLLIVVEGAEKPGNLGAILRSADAAGADGVIVCGAGTDIWNPNVVRASIGTLFSVYVTRAEEETIRAFLKKQRIRAVAASPEAEKPYFDADLKGPAALVMGSEHGGLTAGWLESADLLVRIPMKGEADSLNLSVSTALLLFEALRQRRG